MATIQHRVVHGLSPASLPVTVMLSDRAENEFCSLKMTMADSPHIEDDDLNDEKLTEIVSYLDGELDDTQMVEIEQRLIQDPDMRSHADILSRTWALLDELDEVSASQRFTQDTLATVSAESAKKDDVRPQQRWKLFALFLSKYKVLPCFLAGLIGGAGGLMISEQFIGARQKHPGHSTNNVLLENYDLLQRLDSYLSVPNADSLRALQFPADEMTPEDRGQR